MTGGEGLIIEGVVTTLGPRHEEGRNEDVNISPMGPLATERMDTLLLKPYTSSRTYRNLKRHGEGVFHITDDVELIARATIGRVEAPLNAAREIQGRYIESACRFYEFRVEELDDREERTRIRCRVVHSERLRDLLGFNRARNAVLEAAILASRTAFLPPEGILRQLDDLQVLVDKTGAEPEQRAFSLLRDYVEKAGEQQAGGGEAR